MSFQTKATFLAARDAAAITLDDDADTNVFDALYVGTGGAALKVTTALGNDVTFGNVESGTVIPLRVTRVFDTGTGCSNIVGFRE